MKKNESKEVFPDIKPWDKSVNGFEIVNEISSFLDEYVFFSEGISLIIASWTISTWLLERVYFAPMLAICSPVKRSGKTTLLDILKTIVRNPILTSGTGLTPAVVFRMNDVCHPTFLIDEAEKLSSLDSGSELIGLLNVGHRRGGTVQRCAPENHKIQIFDAFGFRALALIGEPWDTLADRSITVKMERRGTKSSVKRFNSREVEKIGLEYSRKIMRWANDNGEQFERNQIISPRPGWLNDRACDNYEPVFATAQTIDQGFLSRLLEVVRVVEKTRETVPDLKEILLADIKAIFQEFGNSEKIATSNLIDHLKQTESSPWADYSRGKGLSPHQLAKLLKPFNIKPELFRDGPMVQRGYFLKDFRPVFDKYLNTPLEKALHPLHELQPKSIKDEMRITSKNEIITRFPIITGQNPENPSCNDLKVLQPKEAIHENPHQLQSETLVTVVTRKEEVSEDTPVIDLTEGGNQ